MPVNIFWWEKQRSVSSSLISHIGRKHYTGFANMFDTASMWQYLVTEVKPYFFFWLVLVICMFASTAELNTMPHQLQYFHVKMQLSSSGWSVSITTCSTPTLTAKQMWKKIIIFTGFIPTWAGCRYLLRCLLSILTTEEKWEIFSVGSDASPRDLNRFKAMKRETKHNGGTSGCIILAEITCYVGKLMRYGLYAWEIVWERHIISFRKLMNTVGI